jgi:hypothetical protein
MRWTLEMVIAAMRADGNWYISRAGEKFLEKYDADRKSATEKQLDEAREEIERLKLAIISTSTAKDGCSDHEQVRQDIRPVCGPTGNAARPNARQT